MTWPTSSGSRRSGTCGMKAPRIAQAVSRVVEQARNESWSYEDFLTVLLDHEVLARQAQGGEARIRAAHFPARKTVEDFDFTYPNERPPASGAPPGHFVLHRGARQRDLPRPARNRQDPSGCGAGYEGLPGWPPSSVRYSDPMGGEARDRQPREAPGGLPPPAGANAPDHRR